MMVMRFAGTFFKGVVSQFFVNPVFHHLGIEQTTVDLQRI